MNTPSSNPVYSTPCAVIRAFRRDRKGKMLDRLTHLRWYARDAILRTSSHPIQSNPIQKFRALLCHCPLFTFHFSLFAFHFSLPLIPPSLHPRHSNVPDAHAHARLPTPDSTEPPTHQQTAITALLRRRVTNGTPNASHVCKCLRRH